MNTSSYKTIIISIMIACLMMISACGLSGTFLNQIRKANPAETQTSTTTEIPNLVPESSDVLETIQAGFSGVYTRVLPSVVNIQVTQKLELGMMPDTGNLPFPFPFQLPENEGEYRSSGFGSGFVWDTDGHIVTNNHVVENADKIKVTFHDGSTVDGEVVGTDQDSDLAVIKVDYPEASLLPVTLADSTQVQVGNLVAAIGNPFGLQGTMTVGVVSALGRSLPVGQRVMQGSTYTIPDVIQTDAPINPGNSGGVLVNMEAELIGVPTAIESSSGVNAGVGFVVPSVIVQKIVPTLIENGFHEHPWIGISGTTLTSDMAEKMSFAKNQRGVLVVDVVPDSPAEEAGLIGSDRLVTIDEQELRLGGDVIIQIDSQPTHDFEDLTAYLARYTSAGQSVELTVLRADKQETLELTLGVRPTISEGENRDEGSRRGTAWLGIKGMTLSPPVTEAMNLPADQHGVLIQQVVEGSPAEEASLRGSYKSTTINGEQVLVGGDVVVAMNGQEIEDLAGLQSVLATSNPGDEVTLTTLRDGESLEMKVILGDTSKD